MLKRHKTNHGHKEFGFISSLTMYFVSTLPCFGCTGSAVLFLSVNFFVLKTTKDKAEKAGIMWSVVIQVQLLTSRSYKIIH